MDNIEKEKFDNLLVKEETKLNDNLKEFGAKSIEDFFSMFENIKDFSAKELGLAKSIISSVSTICAIKDRFILESEFDLIVKKENL